MNKSYYVAVNKDGRYFTWETDEDFYIIGSLTDDIDKAVRYDDEDSIYEALKVSKNVNKLDFEVRRIDE